MTYDELQADLREKNIAVFKAENNLGVDEPYIELDENGETIPSCFTKRFIPEDVDLYHVVHFSDTKWSAL